MPLSLNDNILWAGTFPPQCLQMTVYGRDIIVMEFPLKPLKLFLSQSSVPKLSQSKTNMFPIVHVFRSALLRVSPLIILVVPKMSSIIACKIKSFFRVLSC